MATRNTKTKVAETEVKTDKPSDTPVKEKPIKRENRRIPIDLEVACISNVKGRLTYISSRAGGLNADWDEFGSVQYLDIRELMSMRNTQRRFFEDNWISIQDSDDGEYTADEIYKFLRVDDKYGDYYDYNNIETFFNLSPKQMKEKVSKVSAGIKELLVLTALDKFESGEIDSIKKKQGIQEALGITGDGEE